MRHLKIILLAALLMFASVSVVFAGCTKTARGFAKFTLSYKVPGPIDEIKQTSLRDHGMDFFITVLKRDGRYNGGCRTFVGRNKARKRACRKAMDALLRHFVNNFDAQKVYVRKHLRVLYHRYPLLKKATHIRIDRFTLRAEPTDRRRRDKNFKEHSIPVQRRFFKK